MAELFHVRAELTFTENSGQKRPLATGLNDAAVYYLP
jgi:hypothetical protein